MRNATILMIRLRGVATEAIKNIVLAGIGKLIIADGDSVLEEDLGAGFFFRDEDVGKNVSLTHQCIATFPAQSGAHMVLGEAKGRQVGTAWSVFISRNLVEGRTLDPTLMRRV